MASLADVEMPDQKSGRVHAHQEMQNRIKKSAGVVGGSQIGGFAGDQEQPETGGDPGLQYLLLCGVQAGEPGMEYCSDPPLLSERVNPRRARRYTKRSELVLFHGIVRRLAGDHDIVHVALA